MKRHNLLLLLFLFNYLFLPIFTTSENVCTKDSDCLNFGQCQLLPDSFTGKLKKQCKCTTDFGGANCELQKCPENPCENDGICELTNSANKFKCHCPLGYSGSLCETKLLNACDTKVCKNGNCRLDGTKDKAVCDCFYGFEGENCDTKTLCNPASCSGHGICSSNENRTSINCLCDSGWSGERCEVDINECENDATLCNNGICVNSPGSYFCRCSTGFIGVYCDKEYSSGGCSAQICQNGGTCLSKTKNGRDFTCKCPAGFTGDLCEENINDCARYDNPNLGEAGKNLSKCTNGGSCIDGINEFHCVCPNGFTGNDCRQNIDECSIFGSSLCQNGGSCIDTYGSYQCACVYGFEGKHCEMNVDDCENNLCYQGSKCIDKIRSYECECQEDRIGIYCQFENPCLNKGKCQNGQCFADITNGNFSCFCDKGFTGEYCNIDINECENSPCYKGKCINKYGGYECECEKGYDGPNCDILIDECEGRPCLNGGTCIDLAGDFKCICMSSWNGKHCEVPKPYSPACDKLMCMHGGVCRKTPFGEEFCQCSSRFSGKNCEMIKSDPCERNNCSENSIKCHPTNNYNSYTCECKNGYGGEYCEQKIQSCKDSPCLVGQCLDKPHGFQCQCPLGYTGINCEININECKQNICGRGICIDEVNGYSCKCPATHTGTHCETTVTDPCQNEPCLNNGTCMTYNIHGSFICKCPNGFTGSNCELRTDICDSTKCQNGGYCNAEQQQQCQCPEGFNGMFCEKNQNKCSKVVCQNGGTCENLDNDFVCKCPYVWPFGFAGRYCEEKINIDKYKPEEIKEKEECQRNECEKLSGNGKCDKECNYPGCNYDGGDCSASNPEPFGNCTYASYCKYVFRDDHCDEICNNEGCLFDGFDCQEKTPSKCPSEEHCLKEYGNGICNPECNSAGCGWDGGDCVEQKEELNETLVLTLITDPENFVKNVASKLLITLSQLLHASVHYQLDSNGNPMIYEWSLSDGQGALIQMGKSESDNSHSIKKRSLDLKKKGVKVYLTLDVSVCQQLSSLGSSLQMDVQIENRKCFTNAQSAADMLAADSRIDVLSDFNITVADAHVMSKSSESSSILGYVVFGALAFIATIMFSLNVLQRHVKKVIVRSIFFPPTSEELNKRQNMHQLQKRPYGNQFDQQSLIGDVAANTVYMPTIDDSVSSVEPARKRFREEQPGIPPAPIQNDRIFTELHQHAASAEPISDAHISRLIPCAKVVDTDGKTCIHWAVECLTDKSDYDVIEDIKKLAFIGCPIDAQDDSGATALHLAVRNGRTEVATYLLGYIDVNIQDDNGRTALFDAVSTKSLEMVQKILQVENVDVNAVAHTNDTALIKCCRNDDKNNMLPVAEALLKHPNVQIDKTGEKAAADYSGRMAIHEAAACNSIQILKLLIAKGAAISAHDVHQQTPLFLAVQSNQIEAVKLLINQMRVNKAEINASNDCDETPLQIALSKGFTEVAELLKNAGAQMPMTCLPIFPPIEHPKYPKMKAIAGPSVNLSPQFPNIERLSSNNNSVRRAKRKKAVPQASHVQQQQQQMQISQANALAQHQMMMGIYPSNDPLFQMPAYPGMQMHQQMLPYPYPPMNLSNYPQTSQPQAHPQQHQQLQNDQTQRLAIQQQNPSSTYSSNPPSAQLPQSLSVSPHVSDSAYGSPNSYQNSTTNTSGHSDTSSNFPSPPSSHDLWPNPSPDTVTGSTSTIVAPIQSSYGQAAPQIKNDYTGYIDYTNGCHNAQYPQQQNWDYQTQMAAYNSSTNLQYHPNSMMYPLQHPYYHDSNRQREPYIPYPQPTMHRSASFTAFPSQ